MKKEEKSSLRFLVDESSGKRLFLALVDEGYDTKFVTQILPSAEDNKILEFAQRENRIIITNDKDFGELIFRLQKPSSGVILLRLRIDNSQNRIKYLLNVISMLYMRLFSNFLVVTENKIRIRKIIK